MLAADSAGAAGRVFRYDEYGIPQSGGGVVLTPANGARFLYTGQVLIPELGMYYYKARIYSPTLGRFMQADPIGYADQMNLYGYVANDPVNFEDVTGEQRVQRYAVPPQNVGIPAQLALIRKAHGICADAIAQEVWRMGEVVYAKTANRSLVGMLNEFSFLAECWRPRFGEDLVALSLRLAETPCGPHRKGPMSADQALWEVMKAQACGHGGSG